MKKLEITTLQSAMIESTPTDLFTVRQAETLRDMSDDGLIRIMRDERLKANLVIMEWKLGTASTAKASQNSTQDNVTDDRVIEGEVVNNEE